MDDFERAKDKIIMGAERRSMVMPEEERRNTAYHESGHAVVAKLLPKTDPVHKVTIIPRGRALGVTMQLPEQDRYSQDRERLLNMIAVLFGGRIAEELFMNQMTTGAANDFERATEIARRMVTQWGMSDAPRADGVRRERGRDLPRPLDHHAQERVRGDACRRSTPRSGASSTSSTRSRGSCSRTNRDKVEAMAEALLELETLDADQLNDIMAGLPPRPPKPVQTPPQPPKTDAPGAPAPAAAA